VTLSAIIALLAACDLANEPAEPILPESGRGGGSRGPDAAVLIDVDEPLPLDAGSLRYACVIGVSEGAARGDGGTYVALDPGGAIPMGGVGQAGLTAKLAYRCTPASDADPALEEADVELILTNVFSAVTAPREPEPVPSSLSCEDVRCDGAVQVEITHLAKLPELEGLKLRVDLRVQSADGELLGLDRSHGVLSPD
jgi:hypothetical protein